MAVIALPNEASHAIKKSKEPNTESIATSVNIVGDAVNLKNMDDIFQSLLCPSGGKSTKEILHRLSHSSACPKEKVPSRGPAGPKKLLPSKSMNNMEKDFMFQAMSGISQTVHGTLSYDKTLSMLQEEYCSNGGKGPRSTPSKAKTPNRNGSNSRKSTRRRRGNSNSGNRKTGGSRGRVKSRNQSQKGRSTSPATIKAIEKNKKARRKTSPTPKPPINLAIMSAPGPSELHFEASKAISTRPTNNGSKVGGVYKPRRARSFEAGMPSASLLGVPCPKESNFSIGPIPRSRKGSPGGF